jgi:hypothetical protein
MTYRTWIKLAGVGAITTIATLALAADHRDAPGAKADPARDITDVYTWVDGANLVFVMNVFPNATIEAKFSDKLQYVFHTTNGKMFGEKTTPLDIICTFDAAQMVSCWAGDEYVKGDASKTEGISSASGKLKVFAGLRDDPFYFNLSGFNAAAKFVTDNAAMLQFDMAGCPQLDAATSMAAVKTLQENGMGMPGKDDFEGQNVLSLVVSIDKALLGEAGPYVSVWAGTYSTE